MSSAGVEHISRCFVTGRIVLPASALSLHRREEAFHRRIVTAITAATHAAGAAVLREQPLELLARVLATG